MNTVQPIDLEFVGAWSAVDYGIMMVDDDVNNDGYKGDSDAGDNNDDTCDDGADDDSGDYLVFDRYSISTIRI